MKRKSGSWLFYVLLLVVFAVSSYLLIKNGEHFQPKADNISIDLPSPTGGEQNIGDRALFIQSVMQNFGEPFAVLLMQMIAILFVARVFGYLFVKMGQPTVIGEIIAGIVLGPSLLGYFYPEVFEFIFPDKSMGNL